MPVLHVQATPPLSCARCSSATDSRRDLPRLPPTITVPMACEMLGIGRRNGYRLVREGRFPVKVIKLGGTYRVVTADLLRELGIVE